MPQAIDSRIPLKVAGRRRPASGAAAGHAFLKTVLDLRGDRLFVPRGIYRFKTFEQAQAWSIRMMARRRNPGRQP